MCCIMSVSSVVFGVEEPHPAKTAQARFNIIQWRRCLSDRHRCDR